MAAFVVLGVELLTVPVGAMGHFWPGDGPFGLWGVLWAVPKVGGLARACPFLGFILLVGFGGTFLVVSILGVVYDCH